MKKKLYIYIFLLLFSSPLFSQNEETDFYGAYPSSYGITDSANNSQLGIPYPHSAHTERLLKKKKKLKLTYKERQVLVKYYAGKELTPQETIILKKALKKREKLKELATKFIIDTLRFGTKYNIELSEYEKDFLKKYQDSNAVLSPGDRKILKMIQNHQKNLEKIKQKYTLSDEEKALIEKAKNDSVHLSISEKIKLFRIKQKKNRIKKIKMQHLAQSGVAVPIRPHGIIHKINFLDPHNRPSSYIRKVHRLEKKYSLSEEELKAYNKKLSGVPLDGFKEKYLAYRAFTKKIKYEEKKHKIDEKRFWSMQDKEVIKRHKKYIRKSRKKYFWKNLNKKLNNIEQALKILLS